MQCAIRAGPEHAGEIAALHAELFSPPWDAASISAMLRQQGAIALLARAGEPPTATGFVMARQVADEAEILSVGVARRHQRLGIGALLVSELAQLAREKGARRLFLEVAQDNEPALRLYRAQEFEEVGRRKGYYDSRHPAADAILMAKRLYEPREPVDGAIQRQL